MRMLRLIICVTLLAVVPGCLMADSFRFTVTADQRGFDDVYATLLAQMQAKVGSQGAFQVMPGDIDPPWDLRSRIDSRFGPTAIWFPGVGNHEEETAEDMAFLRSEYTNGRNCRRPFKEYTNQNGPSGSLETTYTWDYGVAHFIMLNEYWNGGTAAGSDVATDGDVVPQLLNWLAADLAATTKPVIFVFGHEPAYPQYRHLTDSLNAHATNRDNFWNLLESDPRVVAYICGHTHYYSKYRPDGGRVWQIDVGDAGNDTDNNGKTFLDVTVSDNLVKMDVWRDPNIGTFSLSETINVPVSAIPVSASTPSQAKANADGDLVHFHGVVSAAYPGYFYVADAARTSGIRVRAPGHTLVPGTAVSVTGEMKTYSAGERYVNWPSINVGSPSALAPVGMVLKSTGGSAWNPNATPAPAQVGVKNGAGLNNVGMLVKCAGKVTYSVGSYCYVDDGSGVIDQSSNKGIRVLTSGFTSPANGSFVNFGGVVSCFKSGVDYFPQLLACSGLARKPFACYNDCVWTTAQSIGAHVTTHGIGSGHIGATAGPLIEYISGDYSGITATLTQDGGVVWQADPASGGADCNAGTDAYSTFGGIANMTGTVYYGASAGWWVDLELSGLDPSRSYEFATSANRNNATYTDRITRFTLSGADSLANTSTSGVVVTGGGVSSEFCTGYNTANGYVARWTNIRPGADGRIKIRAEAVPGAAQYRSYAFHVFKLALLP